MPIHLVATLARVHGVDQQSRTFSPWSHVVCLLYAQLEQLCAGLREGEIVLFDQGYHVFDYFWALTQRCVFFVTRAKDNLNYRVVQNLPKAKDPRVLKDQLIVLKPPTSRKDYPGSLRLVTARIEVDGEGRVMEFLTNNLEWSAGSDADLSELLERYGDSRG